MENKMAKKTAIYARWATPGGVLAIESQDITTGDRFYVDAGASGVGSTASYGNDPGSPLASLALAFSLNKPTANNGDIIYLMPGHTESVIAAAGIACGRAGVKVIGLGDKDNRPIISFTTDANADIDIDAADITFENISFRCDIADLAAAIDVNASGFTMRNCSFMGTDAADEAFLISVITDAAADDMTIENCQFHYLNAEDGTAITTTSTECIRLVGADRAKIKDCYISGDFTTAAINSITTLSADILLLDNTIQNIATENIAGGIDLHANTTGFMDGNTLYVDDPTSADDIIDDGACAVGRNWVTNAIGTAAVLWGAAGATGVEAKIDVIDGYLDVPVADTTDNIQTRDVLGNKEDAAAAGAVTTTESAMAYVKQIVGNSLVSTADTTDNVTPADVVGNKTDAAAAGAVSAVESLMAYTKQIVGNSLVSTADTTDNVTPADVIGNKTDAAAAGAVSAAESLMAYAKQNVTNTEALGVSNVVPAADTTDNIEVSDVVGNKTDAAAAGTVSATESLMAYIKQLVTELIVVDGLVDIGTPIVITKSITSSTIPDDGGGTPLAVPLTGAASGDLLLESINMQTDSTGLAGPTTVQVVCDNVKGLTGATVPVWDEATANLGANVTISNSMADVNFLPLKLESTKKLYINGDSGVGTGAGVVDVTMTFRRITADASIAAA
jgi:hypothetical protein